MLNFFKKRAALSKAAEEEKRIKSITDYSYDESRVLYKINFEDGLGSWRARSPYKDHFDFGKYEVKVEVTDEEAKTGKHSMKISGRYRDWNGASLDITDYMKETLYDYEVLAWVKLRDDASLCTVHVSFQAESRIANIDFPEYKYWDNYNDSDPAVLSKYLLPVSKAQELPNERRALYPAGYVTDDGWVLLRGKAKIHKSHFECVSVYIETSGEGIHNQDIYVDEFILLSGK